MPPKARAVKKERLQSDEADEEVGDDVSGTCAFAAGGCNKRCAAGSIFCRAHDSTLTDDAVAAVFSLRTTPGATTSDSMLLDTPLLLQIMDDEGVGQAAVAAPTPKLKAVRQPKAAGERCERNPTCMHPAGCTKKAQSRGKCKTHGGGRRCEREGCDKSAQSGTHHCKAHGGGKRCQTQDCPKSAAGNTPHCIAHGGGKRCQDPGCTKSAQGNTNMCKAHGGGKRCERDECNQPARGPVDGQWLCATHGGGPRCKEGCGKSAVGSTKFCILHGKNRPCKSARCGGVTLLGGNPFCPVHGGARHCSFPECSHLVKQAGVEMCSAHGGGQRCEHATCQHAVAQGSATPFCVQHGGGRRCMHEGCGKPAGEGVAQFCQEHGGGRRCKHHGCAASTVRLKGSAQFCRQHAGYQGALECDETDDDDAAAAAAASQPHHPMHASRALEPTISLAEVSFLPFRLQVEVAAALEPAAASAAPQPQPFVAETPDAASPAFVSALHHGGGAGGGAATGSSSGACWSEEPARGGFTCMADGGRCDAGGCEVERLEDRLFCQAHVARCVVLGCGHAAVPGAELCAGHGDCASGEPARDRA